MNDEQLTLVPQSDAAKAAIQAIVTLQRRGDAAGVKIGAEHLLQQFPQCVASLYLNFQLAMSEKLYADAGLYLEAAIALVPEQPLLLLSYAQLMMKQYGYRAAMDYACKAVEYYSGDNMMFLSAAAVVMMQAEKFALAIPVYQRMLTIEPANLQALHQLALCYFFSNNVDGAAELLDALIKKDVANAGAIHLRSALKTYSSESNHISELQKIINTGAVHPAIYYALAKELEDIGDYQHSFAVLQKGSALIRKNVKYNEDVELKSITAIISATSDMIIPSTSQQDDGPIFIVGMPRTGTTLVERILAQHDNVHSIGEFSLFPQLLATMANDYLNQYKDRVSNLHEAALKLDFAELGHRYMAAAMEASGGKTCIIDKLPVNFLYCGFIKKALPNAKIIHLSRNAMDTCYAIYKTLFINAYSFSYDLNELANYYLTYRDMMAHWHKIMPGQILDIQYEKLVTNATATTKELLQWCSLNFTPELLDFHQTDAVSTTASAAQIRKPIYTSSIEKWRNVEAELSTIKVKLQKAGIDL